MAQVKLLKIAADGVPLEMDTANDQITLNSYTVTGGGPVLSGTGLDMNNQDITDIKNVAFNNPAVDTVNGIIANDLMDKNADNIMSATGQIHFPSVTDTAGEVDSLRIPALAGVPTSTPTSGGSGQLIWDSADKIIYAWSGSAWIDTSLATEASALDDAYIAGENLTVGDVVYISAANTVMKAKADAASTSYVVGLASQTVLSAASEHVRVAGLLPSAGTFTAGSRYYLSGTTAGAMVTSPPTTTGHTIILCGYAKNTTDFQIQIQNLGRRA